MKSVQSLIDTAAILDIETLPERTRANLIDNYELNFLYKSDEWKAEHEFRWLVHTLDTSDILIPIEGALKAIIVGVDYPKVYQINLREVGKELDIPVGKISWHKGAPYVNRYKIYRPTSVSDNE